MNLILLADDFQMFLSMKNTPFVCFQFILVSAGTVVIASSPALLCDGESHNIQVTISGNQTLLLVDGKPGRSEEADFTTDVFSHSSTFIGGLPGQD